MENLIDVLNRENSEYEELLKLSQRKTPIIVSGDLEQLQQVTDEEQIVVGRINQLEKSRVEVVADIANVLNKDVDTLKLTNIIAMLAARPAEQKVLAEVHDKLHETVYALKKVNDHNRELLTNSLEMVEFEMNLLQAMKAAPETANYNRGAYNAGATMGVVSGGFDAKQ
ncbi:MAG: flagellar protein FlgN [Lachnospiraceae bacterium]|nr:flagellar protein FlgN [Lachnospiraceae bacterium]